MGHAAPPRVEAHPANVTAQAVAVKAFRGDFHRSGANDGVGCTGVRILPSYILRQHLVPLLLGIGVITFILEMDVLYQYLDLVLNRGVPAWVVLRLFILSLGFIVALSVPCGVLVAVLMTFGRLSQDNEITALRASGVNLGAILLGPLTAAVAVAVGLTLFNNHVLPRTNHAFMNLLVDIGRMRPTVKIQEGVFITDLPGYSMLVQSVNGRTNEMRGVTIYQLNAGSAPTTILAKRGFFSYSKDGSTAVIELKDGEIHEIPNDAAGARKYRRMVFKTHVINIPGAGAMLQRTARESRSDRELSAQELGMQRDSLVAQYRRSLEEHRRRLIVLGLPTEALDAYDPVNPSWLRRFALGFGAIFRRRDALDAMARAQPGLGTELALWGVERDALSKRIASLSVEIHKKFSLPAACVVFVLLGAPLGMRVRRAGPAVAFVSIAFFLFYYLCLVGGEELAVRLLMPPWLAMWLANLVLGGWGVFETLRAAELLPSGPPKPPTRAAVRPTAQAPA